MEDILFKELVPSLYKASPSQLCDINNELLFKLNDIPYGYPVRDEIRDHVSNISTAIMIIHRLGCPMDSETPWMQQRWNHDLLTTNDITHLEEANRSLYWCSTHRCIELPCTFD